MMRRSLEPEFATLRNEMSETEDLLRKALAELKTMKATVKLLDEKVEGWRTHVGSTGYFLKVATEDLTKAVASLEKAVESIKP